MSVCAQTGKWVLSGGEDGSVRVWAPKTGMCKAAFDGAVGHDATVTCVAGSVDGDLVLSGTCVSACVCVCLYHIVCVLLYVCVCRVCRWNCEDVPNQWKTIVTNIQALQT
jgi:hypothetical protein